VEVEKNNEDETLVKPEWLKVRKTETVEISQTSFGHISINSSTILTVSMGMESP